ncbi:DUF4136 domain-containing protein [Pedobacter sp. HMF7647]|uniref:DUF4136 domain-containing protein n=1 Tax=Hufsiella arboris TaxID=2695275 RepID=A0A7K1YFM9_9SPHI|nr:DUF4136 domain-containing protein [Hufsiella arboris]MXV53250.1 DUF4136 domain-containing protein [Hufsiella arboris]
MKMLLISACLLVLTLGCRKTPDLDELSTKPLVGTAQDKATNFSSYKTYFVSDTVAYLSDTSEDTILVGATALKLVTAFKDNMASRGYTFVQKNQKPNLGVRLGVVKDLNVGVYYPGYWDGYYWYWPPYYWGYPNWGYYYPFSVAYAYTTGTVISSMIDLKNPVITDNKKELKVLWNSVIAGALGDNPDANVQAGVDGINQAFSQSPYIKTN